MANLTKNYKPRRSMGQDGFIPMMIALLLIVGAIIYFAFIRVHNAQN